MGVNSQTARSRPIVGGVGPGQFVFNLYRESLSVPSESLADVITYTVSDTSLKLMRAEVSGTNIADYSVMVDGEKVARRLTYFSGDLSAVFDFSTGDNSGLELSLGSVVTVRVTHSRPDAGDFFARIIGVIET